MQTSLKELTDDLKALIDTQSLIEETTVTTYEDLLIRVSENKNEYFGAFLVYDLRQTSLGEWSQTIPFTLIIADKLKADKTNEIFIHSNTTSIAIDLVKILRTWCEENGIDGVDNVTLDIWTESESDSRLAGAKIDFLLTLDIGGYCDIIQN
jgi:hypothetical protein